MRRLLLCLPILVAGTAARAQENVFPRMVGEWREMTTATTVHITAEGNVFAKSGPIRGSVERSITGGGNFSFENEKARCSYDIVLLNDDTTASWGLANETLDPAGGATAGYCLKNGYFIRVESPSEKAMRLEKVRADAERVVEVARQAALDRQRREQEAAAERARHQAEAAAERARRQAEVEAERARRQAAADAEAKNAALRAEIEQANLEKQAEEARKVKEKRHYESVAGDCDRLAAAPDDKDKPVDVPGVAWRDVKLRADEAAQACGNALKVFVDHPRLVFQMARALQWSTRRDGGQRAFDLYTKAVSWKYPAAFDNLASMYRDGKFVPRNVLVARDLWRRGAQVGDPASMYTYAVILLNDGNGDEGLRWLKMASDTGYSPAVESYDRVMADERGQQDADRQVTNFSPARQPPPDARLIMDIFGGMMRGMR